MYCGESYVKRFYPEAKKVSSGSGIFPETLLILALAETSAKAADGNWYPGSSVLARDYNNHFAIKYTGKGKYVQLNTPNDHTKKSKFRVYNNPSESYRDAVKFLQENPLYTKHGVFDSSDYVTQLARIAKAGYAENPNYYGILTAYLNSVKKYFTAAKKAARKSSVAVPLGLMALGFALLFSNDE